MKIDEFKKRYKNEKYVIVVYQQYMPYHNEKYQLVILANTNHYDKVKKLVDIDNGESKGFIFEIGVIEDTFKTPNILNRNRFLDDAISIEQISIHRTASVNGSILLPFMSVLYL